MANEVPIHLKELLTIKEAAQLFNIGETTLRELAREDTAGEYTLRVKGSKILIKRKRMLEFLENEFSI